MIFSLASIKDGNFSKLTLRTTPNHRATQTLMIKLIFNYHTHFQYIYHMHYLHMHAHNAIVIMFIISLVIFLLTY